MGNFTGGNSLLPNGERYYPGQLDQQQNGFYPMGTIPGGNYTGANNVQPRGKVGGFDVGQIDVRTPFMQALESAAAPLLFATLLNPQGVSQQFGQAGGQVPGMPKSSLSSMLFDNYNGAQMPTMPPGAPPPSQGGGLPGGSPGPSGGTVGAPPTVGAPAYNPPNTATQQVTPGNFGGTTLGGGQGGQTPYSGLQPTDIASLFQALGFTPNSGGFATSPTGTSYMTNVGGLLPGSGPAGQELNLGDLNSLLNPQGWVAAAPFQNSQTNSIPQGSLDLLSSSGQQQRFAPSMDMGSQLMQWLQSMGLQTRAGGGPLDPNAFTLVGEQGPELIAPAMMGQNVIPAGATANMVKPPIGGNPNNPGMPGTGGVENLGPNMPQLSGQQASGMGMLGSLLGNNPELDAFTAMRQQMLQAGGAGMNGQGVVNAMQPVFQQNLRFGLNELANRVPSVRNSGAAIEGADLTSRALNDFNLAAAGALQNGQQTQLQGFGTLGQLASNAGNGQFGRALQAGQLSTQRDLGMGQLGLQAQQQQWNQSVGATMQLLMAALGMATPTGYQTLIPGKA
jgi:hypothetical protein